MINISLCFSRPAHLKPPPKYYTNPNNMAIILGSYKSLIIQTVHLNLILFLPLWRKNLVVLYCPQYIKGLSYNYIGPSRRNKIVFRKGLN